MENFTLFPILFPTNLTWEPIPNCSCPHDYVCWSPSIYSKPIECIPPSIDLNNFFHGTPSPNNNIEITYVLTIIAIFLQIFALVFACYAFSHSRRQALRIRSRLRMLLLAEEGGNTDANVPPPPRPPLPPIFPPLAISCVRNLEVVRLAEEGNGNDHHTTQTILCSLCHRRRQEQSHKLATINEEEEPFNLDDTDQSQANFEHTLNQLYMAFPDITKYFGASILMRDRASYSLFGVFGKPYGLQYGLSKKVEKIDENMHDLSSLIFLVEAGYSQSTAAGSVPTDVSLLFFPKHFKHPYIQNVDSPKNVVIVAKPSIGKPKQFVINFKCVKSSLSDMGLMPGGLHHLVATVPTLCHDGEILLHFNPRFDAEMETNEVVMNSWGPVGHGGNQVQMGYGREERTAEFPFRPGKKFILKFEAELMRGNNNSIDSGILVKITVDGKELYRFAYRNKKAGTAHVDLGFQKLEIKGDVDVESVTFPE